MSAHGVAGPGHASISPARRDPSPGGEPERRRQPDLHVVAPPDEGAARRRLRLRLSCAAAGLFVVAVVFALVGLHVVLAQNQFRLDRLDAQSQTEETTYQRLRLQVDQLESPQRIVAAAEGRLGMVQPSAITWLTPSGSTPQAAATTTPGANGAGTSTSVSAGAPGSASAGTSTPVTGDTAATAPVSAHAGSSDAIPPPTGPASDWLTIKPQLVTRP